MPMSALTERSYRQRIVFLLLHVVSVGLATMWLLQDAPAQGAAPTRAGLLTACLWLYFFRICFTTLYLLRRAMPWKEVFGVSAWVFLIHATFAVLGAANPAEADGWVWAGVSLYLIGSDLNTGSEWMRHRWKRREENKGRLYTGGLFRYSMHINYFGDLVLFAGMCLIAGQWLTGWVPLAMAIMFIGVHIPSMDRYLEAKYGAEFRAYAARTKKLIPFLY